MVPYCWGSIAVSAIFVRFPKNTQVLSVPYALQAGIQKQMQFVNAPLVA